MRNHFTYLTVLAVGSATLAPIGCTDLEEETVNEITVDNFGATDDQFIAALGAAYTSLYSYGNHNALWSFSEVSSDEAVIPTRGGDWGDGGQWTRMHQHRWNPDEQSFNGGWNFLYGGVSTCNRLIETLQVLNPERAVPFINELRGLRALYYFWLLDNFGNVPIIASFSGGEELPSTRSRQEVYDFLVAELTEIIPTLDETVSTNTYARVNANVARTILAKVYLNAEVYTGTPRWQEVVDVTTELMDGDYELSSNYFANFNANNTDLVTSGVLKENIFAIPYDEIFAQGFNLGQMTLHYDSQKTFNSQDQPWNGYASLQEFYDSYEDDDVRKGIPGNAQVRGNFLVGQQREAGGGIVEDASADPGDPDGPPLNFTPEINELQPGAFRQAGARIAKFEYEQGFLPNLNNDFPIFRYADVLLMRAEALFNLDAGNTEALDLVNMIRSRANIDGFDNLTRERILAERGREMAFEMSRRTDQIRLGTWNGTWWEKPASEPFRQLFPIPTIQRAANTNLDQNPGY